MNYHFTTKRLIIKQWHAFEPKELDPPDPFEIIATILEPEVTKSFPFMWRGKYDKKRAKRWIQGRDAESKTLLAIEKESKKPVGFINFFNVGDQSDGRHIRFGYFLSTVMWGKGFATELIEGFIRWCKANDISSILAGVDPNNVASMRVLEKNDFFAQTKDSNGIALLYVYDLHSSPELCLNH